MRYLCLLALPLLLAQTGCDTTFPNEEMDIAGEAKTRPFAIVLNTPEAGLGDVVTVTLHYYEPDPANCEISWRVAMDYDLGLYEADEIERDIVELDQLTSPPLCDEFGFCSQSFQFDVPWNALERASSLPDVLTDELILALARPLLDKAPDEPVTKEEVEDLLFYVAHSPPWGPVYTEEELAMIARLSDLYACEIRFRARINGSVQVDVTKNLTIRHSRDLDSVNVNENPKISSTYIQAIPYPDIAFEDIDTHADEVVVYGLTTNGWPGELEEIPLHEDWTYYLRAGLLLQDYTSPYDDDLRSEDASTRWYYYDLDDPGSNHPLFIQDDGGEAEMGDLNESVRLQPPAQPGQSGYRIVTCLRDDRLEWHGYAYTPGVDLIYSEFVFVDP